MRQLKHTQGGFTLIEMGVAVAIIGLLVMAAIPAFASYLANAQLREAANVVLSNAMWARNEAIKLNTTATLTLIAKNLQVTTKDNNVQKVIRSIPLPASVEAADFVASFDSAGRLTPFGTQLTLALTLPKYACSVDIRCPSVRFDAGGSVSICSSGACQ